MIKSSDPTRAVEVFFSYSHKDEDLQNELSKHLYSLRRLEFDFDYEGDIDPGNLPYTRESVRARESDLARAIELDPSIAEALRDRQRASDMGIEEPRIRSIADFNWKEFLSNPPKPMEIKEPWRLKCLRD